MNVEERLNQLEVRLGKSDELVRTLRENFEVIAHMEGRQSALLKDHSQWLVEHDRTMAELDKRIVEGRAADKNLEQRIADLAVAIGEFHPTRQGLIAAAFAAVPNGKRKRLLHTAD